MPVVLLIRHGENDYVKKGRLAGRLPGVHLNKHGREQAQALAEKLAGAPVKAIYSSPLERALETAEPMAKALDVPVITRPGLIEVDVGEWQDKKLKGLSRLKAWRLVQNAPSIVRFPQGETFLEAQCRIASELLSLAAEVEAGNQSSEQKNGAEKPPPEILVCVSHSDPIKLAVAYFIGLPLDHFQRLSVAPASINALYIGSAGSRLLALNYDLSFTLAKS